MDAEPVKKGRRLSLSVADKPVFQQDEIKLDIKIKMIKRNILSIPGRLWRYISTLFRYIIKSKTRYSAD
ncbi:hypothetical protein AU510_00440 [Lonsdalea britannica]|nr:hypothetical protein AU510_00440 [Lonsdalea britannica]